MVTTLWISAALLVLVAGFYLLLVVWLAKLLLRKIFQLVEGDVSATPQAPSGPGPESLSERPT